MADLNTIARPYAEAAFEVARADDTLADWNTSLAVAGELLEDGRIADFLRNPTLDDAKRLEFLSGLFEKAGAKLFAGGETKGTNFLKLLIEYGRTVALPEIAGHFEALKDEVENTVDVTVTSATAVPEARQAEIVEALEERFGRSVNLHTETDEKLIGGAVIKAGDVVIDGSLRARLKGLSDALVK